MRSLLASPERRYRRGTYVLLRHTRNIKKRGGPFSRFWPEGRAFAHAFVQQALEPLLQAYWAWDEGIWDMEVLDSCVKHLFELETEGLKKERVRQNAGWSKWCEEALSGGASRAHQYTRLAQEYKDDVITEADGTVSASFFSRFAHQITTWKEAWGVGREAPPHLRG